VTGMLLGWAVHLRRTGGEHGWRWLAPALGPDRLWTAVRQYDPDPGVDRSKFGGPDLAVNTPRGAWVALYYWSLMVVLGLACGIPHRAIEETERTPSWLC
jgi:hypothetical protein